MSGLKILWNKFKVDMERLPLCKQTHLPGRCLSGTFISGKRPSDKRLVGTFLTVIFLAFTLGLLNPVNLYSQDVRKLIISNLSVTNNSSPVVNKITQGYSVKVRFTAKWEGFSLDRVRIHVTVGGVLAVDEIHEFRDGMGKFQTSFVKDVTLPKNVPAGKQTLTISMHFTDPDRSGRTKIVLACDPVSTTIDIAPLSGQTATGTAQQTTTGTTQKTAIDQQTTTGTAQQTSITASDDTDDDIVLLGEDVGSDNIKLHISTLKEKNWFGEVWLDEISASGGKSTTKNYQFVQQSGKGVYYMHYKFVVLKGTVWFDRSYGKVGTSEDAVAYIDEYMELDSPADRVHTRTLVLKANKYYNQRDLSILVRNYFHTEFEIPKSGIKTSTTVNMPTATASVRGTIYEVNVKPDGTSTLYLYKGSLLVKNESGWTVLIPGSTVTIASVNSQIKAIPFNTTGRFNANWSGIAPSIAIKDIRATSPLFINVTAGGSLSDPHSDAARRLPGKVSGQYTGNVSGQHSGNAAGRLSGNTAGGVTGSSGGQFTGNTSGQISGKALDQHSGNCLGKLKPQFQIPVHGGPANKEQQVRFKMAIDHNKMEQSWFREAEMNFKKGILPKELTGTYRPEPSGEPGTGKYWSQTVTLFKRMKIVKVDGFASGFRLIQGDTDMEIHFLPVSQAVGHVLECGSYKIYVDPDERYEKVWVTVTLAE